MGLVHTALTLSNSCATHTPKSTRRLPRSIQWMPRQATSNLQNEASEEANPTIRPPRNNQWQLSRWLKAN